MNRDETRARILDVGIIPAIRTSSAADARFAAETVAGAGIPIVEVTMTVPHAVEVIAYLTRALPDVVVGAGTVLDLDTGRRCVDAGAHFLTSPGLDVALVEFARVSHVLVMPGALTPTEITAAWRASADLVKVFPCAQVGGASYIHALKAPFAAVPLVAAGGVSQQTAAAFITAGAAAIGVGSDLVPRRAVLSRDTRWIGELTRRFLSIVRDARGLVPRDETTERT